MLFAGGLLTCVGLVLSAYVTSIEWFFVTYGIITGKLVSLER